MSGDRTWIDKDYVNVAERLRQFYERFPDGRLVTDPPWVMEIDGKPFLCCRAKAYRDAEDPLPGDGLAWEPVPGPTSFTKDSELMNAQTAAWGRAIVSLGFETKKIASAEEVAARKGSEGAVAEPGTGDADGSPAPSDNGVSPAQRKRLSQKMRELRALDGEVNWEEVAKTYMRAHLSADHTSQLDYAEMEALLLHLDLKLDKLRPTEAAKA